MDQYKYRGNCTNHKPVNSEVQMMTSRDADSETV